MNLLTELNQLTKRKLSPKDQADRDNSGNMIVSKPDPENGNEQANPTGKTRNSRSKTKE